MHIFDRIFGRLFRLDGDLVPFADLPETWPAPDLTPDGGDVGAASTDRLEGGQGVGFPQAHDLRHGPHRNTCTFRDNSPTACCGFAEYLRRTAPAPVVPMSCCGGFPGEHFAGCRNSLPTADLTEAAL